MKLSIDEFLSRLPRPADERWTDGVPFVSAFTKGDFELEFFAPRGVDHQTPHAKDEFYIIARGRAVLRIAGEPFSCAAGDAMFVAAGVEHRFEDISEDFATWVIFFGK